MIDKIKDFIKIKQEGNNKKSIENLVVFILILIITTIAINIIWKKEDKQEEKILNNNKVLAKEENVNVEVPLSDDLEKILSKIEGVGKVKVYVTYNQTSQVVPIYNEDISQKDTDESDKQGGTRKIIETDTKREIVYEENGGKKTIITRCVINPQIEGAIITAEGGGNNKVKADIISAIEAVTGLPTHKIQVYKMKSEI